MSNFEKTEEEQPDEIGKDPEKFEPEKCETKEDFDKTLEKRAAQLDDRVDKSEAAQKWADKVAQTIPVDKLVERRNKLEESESKSRENFKDACFGEHSSDERAELIDKTKEAWTYNHIEKHRIDMALERLGYDPSQDSGETSKADGKSDSGEDSSIKQTLGETGTKVEPAEETPKPEKKSDSGEGSSLKNSLGETGTKVEPPAEKQPDPDGGSDSGEKSSLKQTLGETGTKVEPAEETPKPEGGSESGAPTGKYEGVQHVREQKEGNQVEPDDDNQTTPQVEVTGKNPNAEQVLEDFDEATEKQDQEKAKQAQIAAEIKARQQNQH